MTTTADQAFARGLDVFDVVIPPDVIEFAHAHLDPISDDRKRSPGVFGAEIEPPADASATEAFLAWTGRQPG